MTQKHLLFILVLLCGQVSFAQLIGFETGIPKQFQTSDKGKITLSTQYYKEGKQSLEWDFRSGSKLNVSLEQPLTLDERIENSYGITLWIYNEVPQQDSIRFEFLSPQGDISYWFSFRLASAGWRACWIGFQHMKGDKQNKEIFSGGEFGKLALYKQDWFHHYPTWNRWATDPQKNGGPFMDAMLHNLNAARYLMGRRVVGRAFFSDDHTHSLACDDTQFLKVDFEQGASAHLFITWAAELAVYDSAKNDREHIDQCFMVTDQGWLFRNEIREGKAVITATRNGLEKDFPVIPFEETFFDRYAKEIKNRDMLPADLPDICEAYEDLRILLEN